MAIISARLPASLARAAIRAAAGRAPVTPVIASFRAHPTAQSIARLTSTAVFAYLVGLLLPGSTQPVLAPLTAVLVVQATLYRTIRSAAQRVASVTAGVLVALAFTGAVGLSWWSLGVTIAVALMIGSVLKLGDHLLEVPISAMLILSLDTSSAVTGRVVDTLVGAGAGLVAGLVLSPVRTQPAEAAIGELSRRMAGLLEEIAAGVAGSRSDAGGAEARLARARSLTDEIQHVDRALGEAEDSLRLKPRALRSERTAVPLRNGLETLEHAAVTIRGLARSITDDARLPDGEAPALAADTPVMLADVLERLAAAIRDYGGFIRADLSAGRVPDGSGLEHHLSQARELQDDRLAPALRQAPEPGNAGWRLRGEILVHLDRLTGELQVEQLNRDRPAAAGKPSLSQLRAGLGRLSPAGRRRRPPGPGGGSAGPGSRPSRAAADPRRRPAGRPRGAGRRAMAGARPGGRPA
ncbi:MAG: hypothetical protein J2P35_07375 [Actinobacteria bacterium]|nr:hypothetical protein [Actinomycetota bacterium]MBO0786802.1 hypothetical protein [Actinomycetota bacterium]